MAHMTMLICALVSDSSTSDALHPHSLQTNGPEQLDGVTLFMSMRMCGNASALHPANERAVRYVLDPVIDQSIRSLLCARTRGPAMHHAQTPMSHSRQCDSIHSDSCNCL